MKYIVRLNKKAYNPLTRKVNASQLWEVEQCSNKDSESVFWHCADIRIDGVPIRELFQLPKDGEEPWSKEVWGICIRGYDDAIEIKSGAHDVSGH